MKYLLSFLFAALLSLLPSAMAAANAENRIKSIDVTMNLPSGGMTLDDGEKLAMTSAKTAFGDLVEKGGASIYEITWEGEFENDDSGPRFKAGYSYQATIKLMLDTNGPYVCDYVMRDGDYYLDGTMLKVTVNGQPARVRISAPYFPCFTVVLTVPGGKGGTLKKENLFFDYTANKEKTRSTAAPYTTADADALCGAMHPHDVVTMTSLDDLAEFDGPSKVFLTKLIIDTADKNTSAEMARRLATFYGYSNLKEVWLSDKVDALAFVNTLNREMCSKLWADTYNYTKNSTGFFTGEATLCIPAKSVAAVKAKLALRASFPCYTVKSYTGDVFQAQKAGVGAAKGICTKHVFVSKMKTADRALSYFTSCQQVQKFYYSCNICGKCERNPNHTFTPNEEGKSSGAKKISNKVAHAFMANLATDQAYVGTNAAGEHIYWKSCIWCGMSNNYDQRHLTDDHRCMAGFDGTLELFRTHMLNLLESREADAKLQTTPQPDMFTLPVRSTAKKSLWAENEVQRALCDNLIDEPLLGDDYTIAATRLQIVSIAVRLAEEMTGKKVAAAKKSCFSDANNEYVRKACAMQLMDGIADGKFEPSAVVTRQEMVTVIYRAMRYIEKNSKYTYTDYDSHLSAYTDSGQIREWAKEPMAFMEALELIDPATPKTLAPGGACPLELALATAERATQAQHTGWAQVVGVDEKSEFITSYSSNDALTFMPNGGNMPSTFGNTDRFWVYRPKGELFSPRVKDRFTGDMLYYNTRYSRPVRWRGGSMKDATRKVKNVMGKVNEKTRKGDGIVKKGFGLLKNILK